MNIGVLIADDQAPVRAGFRMILEADQGVRVVAEASDGAQAIEASRRKRPDIVLMDIRMPVMDGLEATRRIVAGKDPPRVLSSRPSTSTGTCSTRSSPEPAASCSKTSRPKSSWREFALSLRATRCSPRR